MKLLVILGSLMPCQSSQTEEHSTLRQTNADKSSLGSLQLYNHMEELVSCMLQITLHKHFNEEQWKAISYHSPREFIARQQSLLRKMLNSKQLYTQYFQLFQSNHLTLLQWSRNEVKRKKEIQPYLFSAILDNSSTLSDENITSLRQTQQRKQVNIHFGERNSHTPSKTLPQAFEHVPRSLLRDQKLRDEMDSHALYINTFQACNGWKYIFYDYEKHMQSTKQRLRHNENIRSALKNIQNYEYQQPKLKRFEEFTLPVKKTALFTINSFLADSKAVNRKKIDQLMRDNRTEKIVFVNHQRKPINYFLRRQLTNQKI